MTPIHPAARSGGAGTTRRDTDALRRMLDEIDDEGWDGPTATRLLTVIRESIARPLAIAAGLRGGAASQAEASAWAAVWEQLALHGVRDADEPWGVIWRTAQHAVANEVIAARYGTSARRAWDVAHGVGVQHAEQLVGLRVLDFHPRGRVDEALASGLDVKISYATAVTALREVGWPARDATAIVATVAELPYPGEETAHGINTRGWRLMASALDLPHRSPHPGDADRAAEHPRAPDAFPGARGDARRRRLRELSTGSGRLTDVHRTRP
jgi:hypothetical protein